MNDVLRSMHTPRRSGQAPLLLMLLACLLVSIRLLAGFICSTCFNDFEKPKTRNFHLHSGGDRAPCHHGQVEHSPLLDWACNVTQDDLAFILPEVPRLPIIVSLLLLLALLIVSSPDRPLIAAHGRGPPLDTFVL